MLLSRELAIAGQPPQRNFIRFIIGSADATRTGRTRSTGIVSFMAVFLLTLTGCDKRALNNPHTDFPEDANIRYSVFTESPKTLDPARSYSANEIVFTAQIYEPVLQYDLVKRPYTLIPLTARQFPTRTFLNAAKQVVPQGSPDIAYTVYDIFIQPHIYYQPHPAFARTDTGKYRYHQVNPYELEDILALEDFPYQDTRELVAEDYAYEIKRLANPAVQSPIYGLMSDTILGLKELNQTLQQVTKNQGDDLQKQTYIDLRQYELSGVKVLDSYHYQIWLKGQYAQFIYWLAMPFFAPVPWEADKFYMQPVLQNKNITLDWYPIGTGPYMLTENNPNSRMVLSRNPNFRGENFPGTVATAVPAGQQNAATPAAIAAIAASTLAPATTAPVPDQPASPATKVPFIDHHVYNLEKESIPQWTKFLQGYYDLSGISADSFDSAIQISNTGEPMLTPELQKRGIRLYTTIEPTDYYLGFNMSDDVVGGDSLRAKKLRLAINKAVDYEEYISIFLNGRGIMATGPIPPGIFGYREPTHRDDYAQQLLQAKQLLKEAGYANGIDPKTHEPLILNYDVPATAGPGEQALLNWMRKQFAKIGIQLHIRATEYNRFQEKMRTGNAQIFAWGWSADYPDPENFLFLFYSLNGKVKYGGENAGNYNNPTFDRLFEKMRNMPNSPERQAVIDQIVAVLQEDTPWVWGFHPKTFELSHAWIKPFTPNTFANNSLKYLQLDPKKRLTMRHDWNQAVRWPAVFIPLLLLGFFAPVVIQYYRRAHRPSCKRIP